MHTTTERIAHRREVIASRAPPHLRVRQASMGPLIGRRLVTMLHHWNCTSALEIGTCVGIGAAYICHGIGRVARDHGRRAKFIGLEGVAEKREIAIDVLDDYVENCDWKVLLGDFSETLAKALAEFNQVGLPNLDFVYLDGNHKYEPTLTYFDMCSAIMSPGSVILVDDLNWSREMRRAGAVIRKRKCFSCTGKIGNKEWFMIK